MLKLRVLTAVTAVPLILWALLAWSVVGWGVLLAIVVLLGAWEWATLLQWSSRLARVAYVMTLAAVLAASGYWVQVDSAWAHAVLWAAAIFWGWALLEIAVSKNIHSGFLMSPLWRPLSGLLVLYPAWLALVLLRLQPQGEWLTFFFLFLVWGADVGAYFAGHQFGRTKLAPQVSPGKTWEGVAGGLIMALLLSVGAGYFGFHFSGPVLLAWVLTGLMAALVSVLGDLHESRLKRAAGVKDSGILVPGHGGMLDRIDALTSAAPFFVLAWVVTLRTGGVVA